MVAIASLPTTVTTPGRAARAVPPARHARPGPNRPPLALVPSGPVAVGQRSLASVLAGAVAALVVALAVGYLVLTPAPGAGAAPAAGSYVAVEGDTMWSVAVEQAPAGEAATYVERLVEANGGASVSPGQVLTLPRP